MGLKSLKVNLIMNMILTVSSILFPLITFPYISRVLQADGVGKVTFFASIVAYFVMFAQLGVPTYGIRACAKVRDDKEKLAKTVQEIFFINTVMTIISYTVLLILCFSIDRLRENSTLFLIISITVLLNSFGMEWLYRALEEYKYITTRSIFFKFIAVIMMVLFVKDTEDTLIYGAISIFASSASNILNFINIRKHIDFYKIRSFYNIKKHIRPILVFFALTCATTIYTNLDTVMLGFMHNDAAVGYYNASVKMKGILLGIVTSIGGVLLPRLSYYVERGERDKFIDVSNKSFQFIMIISVALTVYFILFSKEVIHLLAGSSYDESILPMQILLPSVVFIGISNLFGLQILVPLGKERLVLYSVIVGAVVNLGFNIYLIPRYAYYGTAFSNLIAELVVLMVQVYYIRDIVKEIVKGVNYLPILMALPIASFLSLYSLKFTNSDFLILVISASIFFLIYYIILRIFKNKFILYVEHQIIRMIRR